MKDKDYFEDRIRLLEALMLGLGQIQYSLAPPAAQEEMDTLREQWATLNDELIAKRRKEAPRIVTR